nr:hypothetical protein HK105_007307 [Polyrhizophydium stewartii]
MATLDADILSAALAASGGVHAIAGGPARTPHRGPDARLASVMGTPPAPPALPDAPAEAAPAEGRGRGVLLGAVAVALDVAPADIEALRPAARTGLPAEASLAVAVTAGLRIPSGGSPAPGRKRRRGRSSPMPPALATPKPCIAVWWQDRLLAGIEDTQDQQTPPLVRALCRLAAVGAFALEPSAPATFELQPSPAITIRLGVRLGSVAADPAAREGKSLASALRTQTEILFPAEPDQQPLRLLGAILPEVERDDESIQPSELGATLLPFQRRSLLWMLDRERFEANSSDLPGQNFLPPFWELVQLPGDPRRELRSDEARQIFVNRLDGSLSLSPPEAPQPTTQCLVETSRGDPDRISGGVLADEMGLGKTIILMALILSHRPSALSVPTADAAEDEAARLGLRLAPSTLVIVPSSILEQWIREIQTHAPNLSVCVYESPESTSAQDLATRDVVLVTYDLVRSEVYAARPEPDRARRFERKFERRVSPLVELLWWRVVFDEAQMVSSTVANIGGTPTSKTGSLSDMHCLFDFLGLQAWEQAARTAVPRSFGSPESGQSSQPGLQLVLRSPQLVRKCLRRIMHRATKASVTHELRLPTQHEHVVYLTLDRIQQTFYDEIEQKCIDVVQAAVESRPNGQPGASTHNEPRRDKSMQASHALVLQMRQACCHPQIGAHNRRALGGDLRTMDEVLEVMLRQCVSLCFSLHHRRIAASMNVAHMHEYGGLFAPARAIYELRLRETQDLIRDIRESLKAEGNRRLDQIADKPLPTPSANGPAHAADQDPLVNGTENGRSVAQHKGADRIGPLSSFDADQDMSSDQESDANDANDYEDDENDAQDNPEGDPDARQPTKDVLGQLRQRLWFWLELEHRLLYFIATLYFHVGRRIDEAANGGPAPEPAAGELAPTLPTAPPDTLDQETGLTRGECERNETEWYQRAEDVRQQTLREFRDPVLSMIERMRPVFNATPEKLAQKAPQHITADLATSSALVDGVPRCMLVDFDPGQFYGGIITGNIFEDVHAIVEKLNAQTQLMWAWRNKVIELLTMPVEPPLGVDNTSNQDVQGSSSKDKHPANGGGPGGQAGPTGEEYAAGLDIQEEANQYQSAYNQALSDRLMLLTAMQRDVAKRYYGTTDLQHQLFAQRKALTLAPQQRALSDLVGHLKRVTQMASVRPEETRLASLAHGVLSRQLDAQQAQLETLRSESKRLSRLGNARILYFRELQRFHNGVLFPEKPDNLDDYTDELQRDVQQLEHQIAVQSGRRRFLENLKAEREAETRSLHLSGSLEADGELENGGRTVGRRCVICDSNFSEGAVMPCGHMVCTDCNKMWVMVRAKCPICNQRVARNAVVKVTLRHYGRTGDKPQIVTAGRLASRNASITEQNGGDESGFGAGSSSYAPPQREDQTLAEQLASIRVRGSFGAKFELLVRHIKHIRATSSNDEKVLVFSQWEQVLDILARAFRDNGIGYVKMEGTGWTPVRGEMRLKKRGQSVTEFRDDPSIAAFMLNAKSQSSGLTLVRATHVILVEPLLNRGIELQAIHRVHRIGQTAESHVWRYVVRHTIEERIARVAARRAQAQGTPASGTGLAELDGLAAETHLRARLATRSGGGGEELADGDVEELVLPHAASQ